MSSPLKIAVVEYRGGGRVLIRAKGAGDALKFLGWVRFTVEGYELPEDGLAVAKRALEERGWVVTEAGQGPPPSAIKSHRMPLPLPECRACHAAYRREYVVREGDRCTECGLELELEQHDPNADARGPVRLCPECGRVAGQTWRYCPCGALLPAVSQTTEAHIPWRDRVDLFAMPDDLGA